MDKYEKLHKDLGKKYNTSDLMVRNIRSGYFQFGYGRNESIVIAKDKLKRKKSTEKIKYLKEKIDFLSNCSDKIWKDLVKELTP